MRLTINEPYIITKHHKVAVNNNQMINNQIASENDKSLQLSNFNSVGYSMISFKADVSNTSINLTNSTIDQLKELKNFYIKNKDDIAKMKKDAQDKLNEIDNWDYDNEKKKSDSAAKAEIGNMSTWLHPFKAKRIRAKHEQIFNDKLDHIRHLRANKDTLKTVVKSTTLNSEQVNSLIKEIDEMIKQKIRQESIDGVQKAINAMHNKIGGLDDRIAGYEYEKDQIKKMYVEPLIKSMEKSGDVADSIYIPPAILLHGATGTGKSEIINAIGAQFSDMAKVENMSNDIHAENFLKELEKHKHEARKKYLEKDSDGNIKKTRTILLINEAEKYLSMTPTEAKLLYGEGVFDESDFELMENYSNEPKYINEFKSLLDSCSEAPRDINDKSRAATTFFITTNYPHIIHPDLLSRNGKMPYIAINPASDLNIEAVLKHYFKRSHDVIERLKVTKDPKGIDELEDISFKAKTLLKNYIINGKIDDLSIDYENIPYDIFAKEFNPSFKKGAFSNDRYKKIVKDSLDMYLDNPSHTFEYYFSKNILREDAPKRLPNGVIIPSGRDINPERYKKFVTIYNMLAPAEVEEKEMLLKMEKMGTIDKKAQQRLNYIRMKESSELKNLEEKEIQGILREEEKLRLEELRKQNEVSDKEYDEEDYD